MRKWFLELIRDLLKLIFPGLGGREKTMEEHRNPKLRRRLVDRIRDTWGQSALLLAFTSILGASGCLSMGSGSSVRTIYVPDGEPVKPRETIKDAKVWVMMDGNEAPVAGVMDLPEGWFALSPPQEDEK